MNDAQDIAEAMPSDLPIGAEFDVEARAEAYRLDAIRRTRVSYFETNCPPAYRDFNPDHPSIQANRPHIDRILAWQLAPKGLLASGKTNRGKTRAMYALCRRLLCEECVDVGIWQAQDFFAALQGEVRFGKDEAESFVRRVAARRVLFIDDFGQHAVQANREEWAAGWFFRLLDLRVGNGLPLLMTTNLRATDIAGEETNLRENALLRRLQDLAEPMKFV